MHVIPVLLEAEAQGLQAKVSLEYRVSSAVAWVTSWESFKSEKKNRAATQLSGRKVS